MQGLARQHPLWHHPHRVGTAHQAHYPARTSLFSAIPNNNHRIVETFFFSSKRNLANNTLSGSIPAQLQLPHLRSLYLTGFNNLCPIANYSGWAVNNDYVAGDCNSCSVIFSTCLNGGNCNGGTNQVFSCTCPTGIVGSNCQCM